VVVESVYQRDNLIKRSNGNLSRKTHERDNLIKRTNGDLSRKTPRSQSGSLKVEESVGGGRRMVKMDERPTQRRIVTGNVSEDRT